MVRMATPPTATRPAGGVPRLRAFVPVACAAALCAAAPATAVDIVYLHGPQADAVFDAGFTSALRQMPAPVTGNPRWPRDRRIGKISVLRDRLMDGSAATMAARVRAAMRGPESGGRVALDELNPNHWSGVQAARLARAWAMLGPDASRVTVYAASAMVEQVGRRDPRLPLPAKHRSLLAVMAGAGAAYLQTYRAGWVPMDGPSLHRSLARWRERWPEGARARLGLLVGPSFALGQDALWARIRGSAAGRALLAQGVVMAGGAAMSTREALDWVAAYRRFLADPAAGPPGGDIPPPRIGAPVLTIAGTVAPRTPFTLAANRPGRAVVRLIPLAGPRRGDARAIVALPFARPGTRAARLPADVRPGPYRLLVTFQGEGTRERTRRDITVVRP
jgi:hypothetical protein